MGELVDSVHLLEDESTLNSRLANFQPLCTQQQKMKPHQLVDIRDIKLQEGLIIKDLLYVLLGHEGSYVRFAERYDPKLKSTRTNGSDYKINKHLDSSLKDITRRLVIFSKMYSALVYFTETFNTEEHGQVLQSLVYEIRQVLKDYVLFLNEIEIKFKFDKHFKLRQFEQDLRSKMAYKITLLYDLVQMIYNSNEKRREELANQELQFNSFLSGIRNDINGAHSVDIFIDNSKNPIASGGQILRLVQDTIDVHKGDNRASEFMLNLFNSISGSYIQRLNNWLTKGELDDSSNEFFIATSSTVQVGSNNLNSEQYWNSRFVVKVDGLPKQFLDRNIQIKVLLTGKYLNIVKECGVVMRPYDGGLVQTLNGNNLFLVLDDTYRVANQYIMDLFLKGYKFQSIISSLNYYYLLTKANKFNEYVLANVDDFKKSYLKLSDGKVKRNFARTFENEYAPQDLIMSLLNPQMEDHSIYETLIKTARQEAVDAAAALTAKNFDSFGDIFARHTQITNSNKPEQVQESESTSAINFVNVGLILPFPLNLVVTRTRLSQYQYLFRHLINLQFTDKLINESWAEINKNKIWRYKGYERAISKWILRSRSLHDRMKDFFRTYSNYVYFDVLAKNLEHLDFTKASNFEDLGNNLTNALVGSLKSSVLTNEQLVLILSKTLEIINGYCKFLSTLRKVLILLDYNLFTKYGDRLRNSEFNVTKNSERMEKANTYLNGYLDSFNEHIDGFIKACHEFGLYEKDLKVLATRLETCFPSR